MTQRGTVGLLRRGVVTWEGTQEDAVALCRRMDECFYRRADGEATRPEYRAKRAKVA